jgi:hypothetical protein
MDKRYSCAARRGRALPHLLSLGLLVAALLSGCAESKLLRNEHDLDRLVSWLPGTYDNTEQAKADLRTGVRPPHDPVELAIVPLGSVSVGRNAFYMQEMAADDPRRVLSQKVLIFNATDKGVVESVATLKEPLRWRDGQRDPDMFLGMTPDDYKILAGCELTWNRPGPSDSHSKSVEPTKLVGANDPKRCQTASHAVMGLVQVEWRAELTANELATAEIQYDANGQLIQGNKDEPFYRFRKIAQR